MKPRAFVIPLGLLATSIAGAQTTRTFSSTSGSDWRTATNWSGGTTFAGDAGGTVTGEGLATDIASFTAAYTSTNLGFNGTNLGGSLTLGAIVYNPASASGTFNSKTFGMSNTSGTLAGTLRLDGATVSSVANTLISLPSTAASGANFTIANLQPGTTASTPAQTLDVVFGHTNGVLNIVTNRTLTFSNNVVNGASAGTGFTKTGGGTLTFGTGFGPNLTGKITLAGGQIRFQGANRTISNAFDVTGSATIYSNNVVTTLSTGAITLSDGITLNFSSGGGSSNRFSISKNIGLASGATSANLIFNHDASNTNTYNGTANIGSGTFTKSSTARLDVSGSLTAGTIAVSGGGAFNVSSSVSGGGAGGSLALNPSTSNTMTVSGAITAGSLTKDGAGTAVLSGNNTDLTGNTTINAGLLDVRNSNALGSSGNVILNSGAGNRLYLGANGITISRPLTINGGGDVAIGALHYSQPTGTATYGGDITVTGPTQAGGHFSSAAGGSLDLTGAITHTAALAADRFIIVRAGSVQLSASGSSYTDLRLSEGVLKLGVANAIPTTATLRVGDNSNAGNVSTFDLNGFDQTIAGLSRNNTGSGSSATVTNSSSTAAILTINNATAGSFNGAFSGNLSLVKQGAGDFSLPTGTTHSHTGATTVEGGRLAVNGSVSTSIVTVKSTAILGGAGTVAGNVFMEDGSTLAPGNSNESLILGGLDMEAGSTFDFEMTDGSATGADLVVVTTPDALSLGGVTLDLTGADLSTWTPPWVSWTKLTLIAYQGAAISSGFAGFADDTSYVFGGNEWLFNYDDTAAGANFAGDLGASTRFVTMTLVPEPSAVLLAATGALPLLRRRRR